MTVLASWLARAAEEITRDGARDAARDELRDRIYHTDDPNPLDRAVNWVLEQIGKLVEDAIEVVPGGVGVLVAIVIALVVFAFLLRLGLGPLRMRDALTDRRRGARSMSAADYRAEAELLAARGDWKHALRARFRAVARELEERGVLDVRAGRTADEIAAEAGTAVPRVADPLRRAATLFDEVWYGDRSAGADEYARMSACDDAIRTERMVTAHP